MKMQYTLLFVVLTCLACVHGCEPKAKATCPAVTVQTTLDLNAYTGRWYEVERMRQVYEPFAACVTADYTLVDILVDGTTYPVTVVNRMTNDVTTNFDSITGGARKADDSGDGRLLVKFPVPAPEGDYWVLESDYNNYSLVYSCIDDGSGTISESGWILTRENMPSSQTMDLVNAAIARNGINRADFIVTRHDETCNYDQM